MATLKDLKPGESGIITEIRFTGLMKRRMIDMGVSPGASVTTLRFAPLGDPVEYSILGYNLSLRKSDAAKIIIEKDGEANERNNAG